MKASWEELLVNCVVPVSHLHSPPTGNQASTLRVDTVFCSAYALGAILCNGAENMKGSHDKRSCNVTLAGICKNMGANVSFFVQEGGHASPTIGFQAGDELMIVDNAVHVPPQSVVQLRRYGGLAFWDALCLAFSQRKRWPWILKASCMPSAKVWKQLGIPANGLRTLYCVSQRGEIARRTTDLLDKQWSMHRRKSLEARTEPINCCDNLV